MNVQTTFKQIVELLGVELRNQGFKKKASLFTITVDGNRGVISFQKSQKSTANEIVFTLNIGIVSGALLNSLSPSLVGKDLRIEDCHWRKRIGRYLPGRPDHWWKLDANSVAGDIAAEILAIAVDQIIPDIHANISDKALMHLWSSEKSSELSPVTRLVYLSSLQKASGLKSEMEATLKELEAISVGKPNEAVARYHIKALQRIDHV